MKANKWYLASIAVLAVALCAAITSGKEGKEKIVELPSLVMAAIHTLFPSATVEKAEPEDISVAGYEVKLKEGTQVKSAVVSADGAVVSVESVVAAETLPDAVVKAVSEKLKGGKVLGAEQEETYMEPQLVKLAKSKMTYEVKVDMDGKTYEIVTDAAGTVLKMEAKKGHKGDKEGKEADED